MGCVLHALERSWRGGCDAVDLQGAHKSYQYLQQVPTRFFRSPEFSPRSKGIWILGSIYLCRAPKLQRQWSCVITFYNEAPYKAKSWELPGHGSEPRTVSRGE